MPNPAAHVFVTAEVYPNATPEDFLGRPIPDFLGMAHDFYGLNLRPKDFVGSVFAAGVAFHGRTDSVFNDQPLKEVLVKHVRDDLSGLEPNYWGAKIACSDPGTEILLDGILLESPDVQN